MSRRLGYAQLLRIPNVFTAVSDVAIGLLVARPSIVVGIFISVASACLYSAGMVWNDFFDQNVDAQERPSRPIPSGCITSRQAAGLGILLSMFGVGAAALVGLFANVPSSQPLIVAASLLACILAYDAILKKTLFGPLGMGACRFLNVLLGFSVISLTEPAWSTAVIVGAYIVGVTILARDEVQGNNRSRLVFGSVVVAGTLIGSLALPWHQFSDGDYWPIAMVAALAITLSIVIAKAVRQPLPTHVQSMIKTAILGVIVLDAALATSLVGPIGLLLLLLLIPSRVLGRWVYST